MKHPALNTYSRKKTRATRNLSITGLGCLGLLCSIVFFAAQPVTNAESIGTFAGTIVDVHTISGSPAGMYFGIDTNNDGYADEGFVNFRDSVPADQLTQAQANRLHDAFLTEQAVLITTDRYGNVESIRP
jgi:hypothetical protein